MKERYSKVEMRPVTDCLISAQHAIKAIVVKGDGKTIFDYRQDNPKLYKLFMDINHLACDAFELYDE